MDMREQVMGVVNQWLADNHDAQDAVLSIKLKEGRFATVTTSETLQFEGAVESEVGE